MAIMPTSEESFDVLESSVSKELESISPGPVRERLEGIDEAIFGSRPGWLIPAGIDARRIPAAVGYVAFRRRYYHGSRKGTYCHPLDAAAGIPKRGRISDAMTLRIARAAADTAYSKAARWAAPFPSCGASRSTAFRALRDAEVAIEDRRDLSGPGKVHAMVDEKYAEMLGKPRKSRVCSATKFRGEIDGRLTKLPGSGFSRGTPTRSCFSRSRRPTGRTRGSASKRSSPGFRTSGRIPWGIGRTGKDTTSMSHNIRDGRGRYCSALNTGACRLYDSIREFYLQQRNIMQETAECEPILLEIGRAANKTGRRSAFLAIKRLKGNLIADKVKFSRKRGNRSAPRSDLRPRAARLARRRERMRKT